MFRFSIESKALALYVSTLAHEVDRQQIEESTLTSPSMSSKLRVAWPKSLHA